MVSIVGNIKINNVGPSSTVLIGNTAAVVLNSNSKLHAGANSFSIGDTIGTGSSITNNQASTTNTLDTDAVDQVSPV
ncbi:spore germination protein [Paenibacillus sp. DMB20]|uniref:spore germination protein n=1 Tax=Paenibacillus sp. DMB20 TaxID=1642570 RepID=UPI000627AB96|nr:spore germination protein [Paenibacillus sp. DMB20]KKO51348.1 spore gernimation protein GerPA [Paenibacillus sp. DMB20]